MKLTVRPVSVIHIGFNRISIPLAGLATTTVCTPEQDRLGDEPAAVGHPVAHCPAQVTLSTSTLCSCSKIR